MCVNCNHVIENCAFAEQFKYADIISVFQFLLKTHPLKGKITVQLVFSLISQKFIKGAQLHNYFNLTFSQKQCVFQKMFVVVDSLLRMIEKWRELFARAGVYGVLFKHLLEASSKDCLPHQLPVRMDISHREL